MMRISDTHHLQRRGLVTPTSGAVDGTEQAFLHVKEDVSEGHKPQAARKTQPGETFVVRMTNPKNM